MDKMFCVYILSSDSGVLYVGMTNNLRRRLWEHKNGIVEGFTKAYQVHRLVYFEWSENVESIIRREKQIKNWRREKKVYLIKEKNPGWNDLSEEVI